MRERYEYVTVVVDHDTGVGARGQERQHSGRILRPDRTRALRRTLGVTIDVLDRFHLQWLAHHALDQVHRAEVRQADTFVH